MGGIYVPPPERPLIVWEPSGIVQPGYIKANGALLSRTAYAFLFGRIGTTWGEGDGSTTFAIPDLRAEFLRGLDDGRGIDPSRKSGSAQGAALGNHYHGPVSNAANGYGYFTGPDASIASESGRDGFGEFIDSKPTAKHPETRPRNVAGLYLIAYAP